MNPKMRPASEEKRKAMPRRIAFNKTILGHLTVPAGKKRIFVFDTKTPNLAYMRTAAGATRFYWIGKVNGLPIRMPLGDGAMPVESARRLAIARSTDRAMGIDFVDQHKAARLEMTFGQLFKKYLDEYSKPRKRTWKEDQAKFDLWLKPLAGKKISKIKRGNIAELHRKISTKSPGAANRVIALVSGVFSFAQHDGLEIENPCQGVQRNPEHQRERFLLPAEMSRFIDAVEKEPAIWKDFFLVALFTGARRGNVMTMRWSELDLAARVWRIPGSKFKNGQDQTIHLPDPVVDILKERLGNKSEYVFPGSAGHVKSPRQAWDRICKEAELTDLHIHDLRRSMGSWLAMGGVNQAVISKTLGHRSQATTARYTRTDFNPIRKGVNDAVNAMLDAAKPKEDKATETK